MRQETGAVETSVGACARFKAVEVGCANHDSPSRDQKPARTIHDPPAIDTIKVYFSPPRFLWTGRKHLSFDWNAHRRHRGRGCLGAFLSQIAEEGARSWRPVSPAEYADCTVCCPYFRGPPAGPPRQRRSEASPTSRLPSPVSDPVPRRKSNVSDRTAVDASGDENVYPPTPKAPECLRPAPAPLPIWR